MSSEFLICDEVGLFALESCSVYDRDLGPCVEVSFPDSNWYRIIYLRSYPSFDEAKTVARELQARLKPLASKEFTGFFGGARLNEKYPELVSARNDMERLVKEWAGEDCVIISVD